MGGGGRLLFRGVNYSGGGPEGAAGGGGPEVPTEGDGHGAPERGGGGGAGVPGRGPGGGGSSGCSRPAPPAPQEGPLCGGRLAAMPALSGDE